MHTPAECFNVIKMAEEKGWKSITVMSFPFHILRVAAQWVYCLEHGEDKQKREKPVELKVYFTTLETVDWGMPAEKTILGGGVVKGIFFDHIKDEIERITRYMNPAGEDEKGKFTPNSTLEELIAYIRRRDGF